VGYNTNSQSIKFGWGTTARRMFNILYANIDIINNAHWKGGIAISMDLELTHKDKPCDISNISFTNITFEEQKVQVKAPHGYARVRNVTFTNIAGLRGKFDSFQLVGNSSTWNIDGVKFKNVTLAGRLLTNETAHADGMVMRNVNNVVFEP